ncbi:carotenoid oxygenase family protein [Microlunatus antarcticus]|uniref:Dioxygenase n=1 Tax=Microlunatus antarcticus TaxID=53388 RepID=A0A7W5P5Y4_9ACTN|nr:carotenoid oxygenase family protein [Microlunatus antarcticus]MBB3325883.1 carotenoid cleavage dioxygenase-like enzyme [Microlunatus antarcticus]
MDDFRFGLAGLDTEVADVDLEVRGTLPAWLRGTLVRNGPGRFSAQPGGRGEQAHHWFDGLAMLQRFHVREGRVSYANRYVRSPAWRAASETGAYAYAEVGTVPTRSWAERVRRLGRPPETGTNAVVNVLRIGGRHVAVTETPDAIPYDPLTLETLDPIGYADDLPGDWACAHPHHEADRGGAGRGALTGFTIEYGRRSTYHVYELADDSLERRLVASVPAGRPAYMHSFALTPRFVVLVEYPLVANALSLLAGRSLVDSFDWRPSLGTRFTVVERASGAVVCRSVAPAFFCYHQVNAFEDDGALLVDLPSTPGEQAMHQFDLDALRGPGPRTPAGELRRYRVPLDGGPVTYRLLSTTPLEFPRIAYESRLGRPYRYVFGVGTPGSLTTSFSDRLVKVDVEDGSSRTWAQPGCWPGEPVLVADPSGHEEDAGVVLSLVLDSRTRTSFLLVLDAATFREVARAKLPHAAPLGFHGQWYAG